MKRERIDTIPLCMQEVFFTHGECLNLLDVSIKTYLYYNDNENPKQSTFHIHFCPYNFTEYYTQKFPHNYNLASTVDMTNNPKIT